MSVAIGRQSLRTTGARTRRPSIRGQSIRMEAKRFGYFPQTFVWRGKRYDVHAVERCWTISRRWMWDVERHCFRVRCAEGTFELYQDVKRNTWHVDRFERATHGGVI
jgi:hypothetical protein